MDVGKHESTHACATIGKRASKFAKGGLGEARMLWHRGFTEEHGAPGMGIETGLARLAMTERARQHHLACGVHDDVVMEWEIRWPSSQWKKPVGRRTCHAQAQCGLG